MEMLQRLGAAQHQEVQEPQNVSFLPQQLRLVDFWRHVILHLWRAMATSLNIIMTLLGDQNWQDECLWLIRLQAFKLQCLRMTM